MADPENFGGGDLKHKTSKIRISSPKLRVIFRPNSEIQTFFLPKFRWSPKEKKKKVFTKIETDFSAEIGNSNVFFAQIQVVSKKKKKKKKEVFTKIETDFSNVFFAQIQVFTKIETDFSPDSFRLGRWGGDASRNGAELFETEADFLAKIVTFTPPPKSVTARVTWLLPITPIYAWKNTCVFLRVHTRDR